MPTAAPITKDVLAQNRAEEYGYDVWPHFVIPPTFSLLSLDSATKPKVIIGGRGCGKTMLLRYLSHDSLFSKSRTVIPDSVLSHVGLYWRADTQFAQLMSLRGVEDDAWHGAFRHLAALVIGTELFRSLASIADSTSPFVTHDELATADFSQLLAFDNALPNTYTQLCEELERRLFVFESWVNDVRSFPKPAFLPGESFIKALVTLIRRNFNGLAQACYFVYVDEYENLAVYQQRIINTWLKHSAPPLVFNLAMKRNGFKTRQTVGDESLNLVHDFREIDLESFEGESGFFLFAAEVLLLKLAMSGIGTLPFDAESLRDPAGTARRTEPTYAATVLKSVSTMLPDVSQRDLAQLAVTDDVLISIIRQRISKALTARQSSRSADDFIDLNLPEATVVCTCLVYRESLAVDSVFAELSALRANKPNKFLAPTDWIHNNFIGCFLHLYDGVTRPCPLFSGFETFCRIAKGNLRHFLELCHQALTRTHDSSLSATSVSTEHQAKAARHVSATLLSEVKSFGPKGNNLHTFVLRIGSMFSLSQQRPSQSEPERSHFSIKGGVAELSDAETALLSEAVKWSVLFEEKETKKKSLLEPEGIDFVLNPVYAPYFNISYRKRRKLELTADEAKKLISGSYQDVRRVLNDFSSRWEVDVQTSDLPLFAHLTTEEEA